MTLVLGQHILKEYQKEIEKISEDLEDGEELVNQNNDFIEDVPLGDLTNLNTVEFKYFGF